MRLAREPLCCTASASLLASDHDPSMQPTQQRGCRDEKAAAAEAFHSARAEASALDARAARAAALETQVDTGLVHSLYCKAYSG